MFGLIVAGRPVLDPSALQSFSQTEHAWNIPASPAFSHIVVFLLPGTALPPDAAVGVFIQFPKATAGPAAAPGFRLLGGLSADKQSAIFHVRGLRGGTTGQAGSTGVTGSSADGVAEVDMDADDEPAPPAAGDITIGLQIQPAAQLAPQLAALGQPRGGAAGEGGGGAGEDGAMTLYRSPPSGLAAKALAQRIIRNAFNYLASFAQGRPGEEVVPLRSFEAWWRRTESRFDADPGFLEREADGA